MHLLTTMGGVGAGWSGRGSFMRAPAIFFTYCTHSILPTCDNEGGAGFKPALKSQHKAIDLIRQQPFHVLRSFERGDMP